jgi:hypothetical protein
MKNQLYLIFLLLLSSWFCPAMMCASEPQEAVKAYFEAMKNGDIQTMKSYMGGKLYQRRKDLLEKNQKYPEFLIDFYEGTELEVLDVQDEIVHIGIQYPNGSKKQHKLVLQKDPAGQWKVIDELTFDR